MLTIENKDELFLLSVVANMILISALVNIYLTYKKKPKLKQNG